MLKKYVRKYAFCTMNTFYVPKKRNKDNLITW